MKLSKENINALESLLGKRNKIKVIVLFRFGKRVLAELERDKIKSYDGNTRYRFSWSKGRFHITTEGNGMRYSYDSDYDVVSVMDCDTERIDIKVTMDYYVSQFYEIKRDVFSKVKEIMKKRDTNFINLQSKSCDAIYTHIFNDQNGKNEEYRVLGLVNNNDALMIVGVHADEEDKIKIPLSDDELTSVCQDGGNHYLRCVRCDAKDVNGVQLAFDLARFLYPHLL